jgi:hypothetical protein
MMRPGPFLAALFVLVPYVTVVAQAPAPLPGTRVRVTLPCQPGHQPAGRAAHESCRSEGPLLPLSGQAMALAAAGPDLDAGRDAVTRLEVSRGQRSHWRMGAAIGFLAGAGATFAALRSGGSTANQDALATHECIGLVTLGGAVGAGLGAAVGALFQTERWQEVPLRRGGLRLAPQPGARFGLALKLAF